MLAVIAVVLLVAAVVLLVAGVEVRETTGGLLVTPIRQVHLVGGYLVAGTVAGVAAVLTALVAVPALRRGPAREDERATESTESTEEPTPSGEPASLTPGTERST
ncbi:hypothetical protein EV188_11567 [Actinomycetospora succinea]|uniref:Uncharacterized protein n=1 Tax=Actinomycetospora succinea TaxID=663603 RepID=A0A4R6UMP6_9PSEU|nr:hypothetical protein EV188_11567 [Actinomycetospora succinea]